MEKWFQPKQPEQLEQQVSDSSELLGEKLQPSLEQEDLFKLPIEEIKTRFPERYQIYLKLLRYNRGSAEINNEELDDMQEWIGVLNNLDVYIEKHKSQEDNRVLRDRQFTVFEDIRDSLEEGQKEGYVKLPTGVGKTVLFSQVVDAMGVKTLIVVPSKVLVGQTGSKLDEFTDLEHGSYFQENKDLAKQVTITTYQSLVQRVADGTFKPEDFKLLILDEAHKAIGEKTQNALASFDCVKLGFTATPQYSYEKGVSEVLSNKIHEMSIKEAVEEGLLNRFKAILAYTSTDLSEVKIKGDDYDEASLKQVVNNHARNLSAVQLYQQMFEGQSAIVYCGGTDHAKEMEQMFMAQNISSAVLLANTSPERRKEIIEDFRSGKIKVLCNVRILVEGFDEPKASVALNLQPTLSRVVAEQRAGRVLRLDPNNQEKWSYIVDFVDEKASQPGITFSEIARASELEPKEVRSDFEKKGAGHGYVSNPDIQIENLRVIVDPQEVWSLSQFIEKGRIDSDLKKELTFNDFVQSVRFAGLLTVDDYKNYVKNHSELNWPVRPDLHYKFKGWESWLKLFNKERKKFLIYSDFEIAVRDAGLKSLEEYAEYLINHPELNWPSNPNQFYKNKGWEDWYKLFGREKLLNYDEFQLEVGATTFPDGRKLDSEKDYYRYRKENSKSSWPSQPEIYYHDKGWQGWPKLFKRESKIFLSFSQFEIEVKKMSFKNVLSYKAYLKANPELNWPTHPNRTYKDKGWKSWSELFDNKSG
ncbi:MAG: DEAD/DEAH box helicase [Patescibacteria group bacterium]|jgi:superfamily II DNA or RNA helicase